jgi:hypothetical protein
VGPAAHDGDGVRGYDRANGANALADETGISGVKGDPQAGCAGEPRDVPIAEVHPEQIAVRAAFEVRGAVLGVTAGCAGPPAQWIIAVAAGDLAAQPSAHGEKRDAGAPGDLRPVEALAREPQDEFHLLP